MKKSLFIVAILSFAAILSCGRKDPVQKSNSHSANDAGAVSANIKIDNATRISGTPPAPSTEPNAPKLNSDPGNNVAISGRKTALRPNFGHHESDIKGMYLKVVGASDYFDIPLNKSTGRLSPTARTMGVSSEDGIVFIEIPSIITEGTFCMEYCVYDAENRISNIITKCIEVSNIGGGGADFLMGKWQMTEYEDSEGKYGLVDYIQTYHRYSYCETEDTVWHTYQYPCGENPEDLCEYSYFTFKIHEDSIEVSVHSKIKWMLEFAQNGGTTYDVDVEHTETPTSTTFPVCGDTVEFFEFESYKDQVKGAWAYKEAAQKLVFVYDITEHGYEEPWAIEFQIVSKTADKLVLKWDDENETIIYTLERR